MSMVKFNKVKIIYIIILMEIFKIVFKVFFCVVEVEFLVISKILGLGFSCVIKCNV